MINFHMCTVPLVSAMHVLIFFTTFHRLLKLVGPSHFIKSIFALYIDSDEVAESEGNDWDDSFFTSKPVVEDLDLGEGMLLVKVILSGANSVTHLITRRLKNIKYESIFSLEELLFPKQNC